MVLLQSIRDGIEPAHTNKIFSCRFAPDGSNMIYTGGWDNAVRFWDVRSGDKLFGLLGPQINGECVDLSQDMTTVLTGGGTLGEGLQLWDMRNMDKPFATIKWDPTDKDKPNPMTYCCRFVPHQPLVLAGARDEKAAKCFDINSGSVVKEFPVPDDCYAMDISRSGNLVGFGDGGGWMHMENLNYARILDD